MYDKVSECVIVNGVRMDLFVRKGRVIDNIFFIEVVLF